MYHPEKYIASGNNRGAFPVPKQLVLTAGKDRQFLNQPPSSIKQSNMEKTDMYKKVDECIGRFKNGEEKYKKSALFNKVVQMLARGADPYEVIEQLVQVTEDTQEAFQQYMLRSYTLNQPR